MVERRNTALMSAQPDPDPPAAGSTAMKMCGKYSAAWRNTASSERRYSIERGLKTSWMLVCWFRPRVSRRKSSE